MFNQTTRQYAVIGLGLFGRRLALELSDMDHQVLAIDQSEEAVATVQDAVNKAVIGDVKKKGILEELLSEEFAAVIVTMATDLEANLLSVFKAQEMHVGTVIAKSSGPEHTTILERLNVDTIISPEEDVAQQLAETIGNPRVHEYMHFQDGHDILMMTVPDDFVGKTLRELKLRDEHGIQVIGIQKQQDENINYVPSPTEPFEEGDVVWVVGPEESLDGLSRGD